MIGPSKLSSIICRWDDELYFILIQAFIAVIQGETVTLFLHHNHKHVLYIYAILTILNVQYVVFV